MLVRVGNGDTQAFAATVLPVAPRLWGRLLS